MNRLIAAALLAAFPFASAGAGSPNSYTETINITATVPVICYADFFGSTEPQQLGQPAQLGTISEFCNDGRGYTIYATYTPSSDPGELVVDGQTVPLDTSGNVILTSANGPRILSQQLAYIPGSTPISSISIALRAASL